MKFPLKKVPDLYIRQSKKKKKFASNKLETIPCVEKY